MFGEDKTSIKVQNNDISKAKGDKYFPIISEDFDIVGEQGSMIIVRKNYKKFMNNCFREMSNQLLQN